jgi:protein lifeguard
MSTYPSQAPPTYGAASAPKPNAGNESREPLLASSSRGGGAFYDQPDDDLPDDFKVPFYHYVNPPQLIACSTG